MVLDVPFPITINILFSQENDYKQKKGADFSTPSWNPTICRSYYIVGNELHQV